MILADDDGNLVQNGKRGILHIKTPSRFVGYVHGETKHKSLYQDWLNTGDVGFIDAYGELHITDRIDDMIVCGAHKIYPGDIEALILQNEAITDCAVTSYIYKEENAIGCVYTALTDQTNKIIRHLRKSLMSYEIPKHFVRVDAIPRNAREKIDKQQIKKILTCTY